MIYSPRFNKKTRPLQLVICIKSHVTETRMKSEKCEEGKQAEGTLTPASQGI